VAGRLSEVGFPNRRHLPRAFSTSLRTKIPYHIKSRHRREF